MRVEIVYPEPKRLHRRLHWCVTGLQWLLIAAACLCPALNLVTGGKAWSVIVLWALHMCWSLVISPARIEYNRISQFIKLLRDTSVLLLLVDWCLAPGWAVTVVPIVCFAGLIVGAALLFTDWRRQRQNLLPLLLLAGACLVGAAVGLFARPAAASWPMAVMGVTALLLLAACAVLLGPDCFTELRKRFHTR